MFWSSKGSPCCSATLELGINIIPNSSFHNKTLFTKGEGHFAKKRVPIMKSSLYLSVPLLQGHLSRVLSRMASPLLVALTFQCLSPRPNSNSCG